MPAIKMCPRREISAKSRVSDLETLTNLIYFREVAEIKNIIVKDALSFKTLFSSF